MDTPQRKIIKKKTLLYYRITDPHRMLLTAFLTSQVGLDFYYVALGKEKQSFFFGMTVTDLILGNFFRWE